MPHRTMRVLLVALATAALLAACAPAQASVPRGVSVDEILRLPAGERDATLDELAYDLRAKWLKAEVQWFRCEPAEGVYDEEYIQTVVDMAEAASRRGLKVMLTMYGPPEWASDPRFWQRPPNGLPPGYRFHYAPRLGALPALQACVRHLAARCGAAVAAFEAWNEPNLWMFLCPQQYGSDARFGARRYLGILKAFWYGVNASGSDALVIGGVFGPYGSNDWRRTSPNLFARYLKDLGAGRYMDAVSHHPYQTGSSATFAPESLPRFPSRGITLANLATLIKLFPTKPLYLSEYGYNTQDCLGAGGLGVGGTRQADYLRRAYAYVARYPQVKVLIWYLLRDTDGYDPWTTGLRSAAGTRKLSWYAFSRAARLTLVASQGSVRARGRVRLSGRLTWYARGEPRVGLEKRTIVVSALRGGAWQRIAVVRSTADGSFSVTVRPSVTTSYRVRWTGVVSSPVRTVVVR